MLAGTTVSRATLHNPDEVKRLGIRIGDWVLIEKGGDVIPKVLKVIESKRTGEEKPFRMPRKCPVCRRRNFEAGRRGGFALHRRGLSGAT